MVTYLCMFCGVTCHAARGVTGCAICGKTIASGWLRLQEESNTQAFVLIAHVPDDRNRREGARIHEQEKGIVQTMAQDNFAA